MRAAQIADRPADRPAAWRTRDTVAAATLSIATAAFTLWQNARVAVLWDIGFLLDTSYRWSLGQLPYRDLPFPYAPLTFLLHTALIRLFGRVYFPHIFYAALAGAAATLLTWRILLHLLKPLADRAWTIATMLAAPLTVLGIYSIYPHPIYDSDCILAVLFSLYLLQRAEIGPAPSATNPARNALAGAACVLPLFIKQNIGLPLLLIALAAVAAIAIARRVERATVAPQLWFFAGALTVFAAAALTQQATVGLRTYLYWTIAFAAQRRLPGLGLILGIYRQASLLWTLSAAAIALVLLKRNSPGARSRSRRGMGGTLYRSVAVLLLAAPFLWTIASLADSNSNDPSDRAAQLLSLWPHLLLLGGAFALWNLRRAPTFTTLLPLILLATIHGVFLSQQLWGSTYAIWPLLILLLASMLTQIPTVARPVSAIIAATLLLCGGLYAASLDRLSYIHLDGLEAHATLPALRGLTTPGPWIPGFEELVRFTEAEIPADDSILLIPGEDPFYFATGRTPHFPILLFDPATDPYTAQQTLDQVRAHNIRWLIVTRNLQLTGPPHPDLPAIVGALHPDFTLYRTLTNYDVYRSK